MERRLLDARFNPPINPLVLAEIGSARWQAEAHAQFSETLYDRYVSQFVQLVVNPEFGFDVGIKRAHDAAMKILKDRAEKLGVTKGGA